jgi:hypothetical protein
MLRQGADSTTPDSFTLETNQNFIGRFHQPQIPKLRALWQNTAQDLDLIQEKTDTYFIAKFRDATHTIFPTFRFNQSMDLPPIPVGAGVALKEMQVWQVYVEDF